MFTFECICFIFRHLYPPPSYIISGGENGSFVRTVAFSPDNIHLATVCDDS